ncbi:MAG: sulfotransferase domain-containing protein [Chitinophagales bacterium]
MENKIDFIGIGTAKSASTTIARFLEAHPQICLSIPQKVLYFNTFHAFWVSEKKNWRVDKPMSWYFNHFKHCPIDSVKGEYSSIYFSDPDAPERIFNTFPKVKLIVCFRNPVDRAYSYYQMTKNYHAEEKRTFLEAVQQEKEYIERGLYFKYLSKYLQYFDKSQICVLTFEEVKNTPAKAVRKLYRFLGVDENFLPEDIHLKANSSKQTKSKLINRFEFHIVRTISAFGGSPIIQWLKKNNFHEWFHKLYLKPDHYAPLKEEDRIWLKQLFLEDIEQLEEFLKMDLSHWK